MHFLQQLDLSLLFQVNTGWTSPFLDRLMLVASSPKFFLAPIAIGVLALLAFGGFKGRVFLVLIALALVLGDGVIDKYGKRIVHRPRPNEALTGVRVVETGGIRWAYPLQDPGGRSFPSGHAFNNVALALIACAVYGSRRFWWLWLWAALVSYSRVYLGAHYPSDILGSWLLAILYSLALLALAKAAWRRFAARLFPRLAAAHPDLLAGPGPVR